MWIASAQIWQSSSPPWSVPHTTSYLFASPGFADLAVSAGLCHPVRLWGSMRVKQAVIANLDV